MTKAETVEEYIDLFPESIRKKLVVLRSAIREAAPEATEVISYGMPAYKGMGVLVYFAAQKKHIGFYPTASGVEHFRDELAFFPTSKGTVQFSYEKELPLDLIKRIVAFRVTEDDFKRRSKASGKEKR